MTQREYKSLTLKAMKARRWRLVEAVVTGAQEIEAGIEVRIIGKSGGNLEVAAPQCPHCKVTFYARRVPARCVEEITP